MSLVSRRADFWLMGGVSLVVWVVVVVLSNSNSLPWADHALVKLGLVSNLLSILIFQPHFIFTYRMAYRRGGAFLRRYWFQLFGLPAILMLLGVVAYSTYDLPIRESTLSLRFPSATPVTYGQTLLSVVLTFMFTILGWHHAKQTFGCMMTYRKFDSYPLSNSQRRFLLGSIYAFWAVNVVVAQAADQLSSLYGLPIFSLTFLEPIRTPVIVGTWGLVAWNVFAIAIRNRRDFGVWPSRQMAIPFVAIIFWWLPPLYNRNFYVWYSTVFHALQYWPFAMRYERMEKQASKKERQWSPPISVGVAVALGIMTFGIPMALDSWWKPEYLRDAQMSVGFFVIALQAGLNIHHYFLDSVIWRSDQPEIQKYICGEPTGERTLLT